MKAWPRVGVDSRNSIIVGKFHGTPPTATFSSINPEAVIRSERMTAHCSHLGSFGQKQRVLYIHTEIPHRVLDLGVFEQYLNGA